MSSVAQFLLRIRSNRLETLFHSAFLSAIGPYVRLIFFLVEFGQKHRTYLASVLAQKGCQYSILLDQVRNGLVNGSVKGDPFAL